MGDYWIAGAETTECIGFGGFSADEIGRIHGPIGVDINARRPREIALSIMGELVQIKNRFL